MRVPSAEMGVGVKNNTYPKIKNLFPFNEEVAREKEEGEKRCLPFNDRSTSRDFLQLYKTLMYNTTRVTILTKMKEAST